MPAPLVHRQYQIFIDRPPEAVFAFHTSLKNMARLTPPNEPEEVVTSGEIAAPTELRDGLRYQFRTWRGGAGFTTQLFEAEVFEWNPPHGFAERQISGPFALWVHRRKLVPFQAGTLLTDTIEYTVRAGALGTLGNKLFLGKQLDEYFRFRQSEAKRILEKLGRIKGRGF